MFSFHPLLLASLCRIPSSNLDKRTAQWLEKVRKWQSCYNNHTHYFILSISLPICWNFKSDYGSGRPLKIDSLKITEWLWWKEWHNSTEITNSVCSSDNINFESKVTDLTDKTKNFSTVQHSKEVPCKRTECMMQEKTNTIIKGRKFNLQHFMGRSTEFQCH
jgi:hypothetical protein